MKLLLTAGRAGRAKVDALLARAAFLRMKRALPAARRIVDGVRTGGDAALLRYAAKFDGNTALSRLRISPEEMQDALENVSPAFERALRTAAKNIRAFAERQKPKDWNYSPAGGVIVGQRIRPICNIGCYIPSGRYPLPSTLLMTAIPAQVAGVERIVAVSPEPARETAGCGTACWALRSSIAWAELMRLRRWRMARKGCGRGQDCGAGQLHM